MHCAFEGFVAKQHLLTAPLHLVQVGDQETPLLLNLQDGFTAATPFTVRSSTSCRIFLFQPARAPPHIAGASLPVQEL
jgi:hypothetical protein